MNLVTYTCGTCGAERQLKWRPGKVNLSKDCHSCAGKKTRVAEWSTKHGDHRTALYAVWCGMKQRCSWPGHVSWKRYGGRGIQMCSEWKNDFSVFRDWALSSGYASGLTIDRKDNSLGYSSDNCRWVTSLENSQNSSQTKLTIAGACVIRDLARLGVGSKLLAALYQVHITTVCGIKYGRSWRNAEAQLRQMEEAA